MAETVASVKIKGLKKLLNKYQKLPVTVESSLLDGVNTAAGIVEASAKTICPVDTGLLRSSIHTKPATMEGKKTIAIIYTGVEYAPYVEFGTGVLGSTTNTNTKYPVAYSTDRTGQVAQPYLTPALENNASKIERLIDRAVVKGIARV